MKNNIKVEKARGKKVFAAVQRCLCGGRRRVSSVEDKGRKR